MLNDMNDSAPSPQSLLRLNEDSVAFLTLNRPKQYNALSRELLAALHDEIDDIARDDGIRVVAITGAGPAFCSGHDLKQMRTESEEGGEATVASLFKSCSDFMLKLTRLPQPVIAEVNGMAAAAGCQLVAQCDLAVAVEDAKFAVSGINYGLFCSTPAVPLTRTIARKRAAKMLFTGEFIDAATALEWGLVNRVVPASGLRDATLYLADTIKAKPREAIAMGKSLFYRQLDQPLEAAYRDASETIACNFMHPVAQEGVEAFIQKRPPKWD
jgi:enoyl-CoA hydratase/carnithine racemase